MDPRNSQPLKILCVPSDLGNCYRWRMWYPLQELRHRGLVDESVLKPDQHALLHEIGIFNQFDLILFERQTVDCSYLVNRARGVGCAVAYDLDDDLAHVRSSNPAYVLIGPDERIVREKWNLLRAANPEGQGILEKTAHTPFEEVLRKNREARAGYQANLRNVDGVQVTTPALRQRFLPYNKNVAILPNLVHWPSWEGFQADRPDDGVVRIMWAGGDSHYEDLLMIQRPLIRILKRYPQVEFHLMGFTPAVNLLFENAPRVVHDRWSEYPDYQRVLSQADIVLAPSAPNAFNECKSVIRVYESLLATQGHAAIIASDTTYGEIMAELGCGVTVKNHGDKVEESWEKALRKLITQPDLRVEMGRAGYKKLHDDRYSYSGQIHRWYEFYSGLIEEAKDRWTTSMALSA